MCVLPILAGTCFTFWTKRRAYQWRLELCDEDFKVYPRPTEETNKFVRKLHDESGGTRAAALTANPGLGVREALLTDDETAVLRSFVREICDELGSPIPEDGVAKMHAFLEGSGLPTDFLAGARYVSDRYEGVDAPRATWGCGDALRLHKLPLPLRALNHKLRAVMPHLGQLRHIYVERSPGDRFFRTPRPQRAFDGHEFVVIPLFGADGAVLTFSPSKRDLNSNPASVLREGWSTADVDVFVPPGAALQVRSMARFRWAWGVRPDVPQFFGNPANRLPLGSNFESLARAPQAAGSGAAVAAGGAGDRTWSSWFSSALAPAAPAPPATGSASSAPPQRAASAAAWPEDRARSVIVLAYEGPLSEKKQRAKTLLWEQDCFGEPPKPEHFAWSPDTPPSVEDVQNEGVIWWLVRNYPRFVSESRP